MKETGISLREKLLLDSPVVHVTGMGEVCVENYHFLRLLTEEKIQIQAKNCRILISGRKLVVVYYTREAMKIQGKITSIQYHC